MYLRANPGCWLTQAAEDIEMAHREWREEVYVATMMQAAEWREVTEAEKQDMIDKSNRLNLDKLDYQMLQEIDRINNELPTRINDAHLTDNEALSMQEYYPLWQDLLKQPRQQVDVGFRFQYDGVLFTVIQPHTLQEDWKPGVGTESLYQVVQVAHEGTQGDPIPWQHNMVLENGKFYTDKGVLYECIRDSGIGMVYDLKDLVSGGYVKELSTI